MWNYLVLVKSSNCPIHWRLTDSKWTCCHIPNHLNSMEHSAVYDLLVPYSVDWNSCLKCANVNTMQIYMLLVSRSRWCASQTATMITMSLLLLTSPVMWPPSQRSSHFKTLFFCRYYLAGGTTFTLGLSSAPWQFSFTNSELFVLGSYHPSW